MPIGKDSIKTRVAKVAAEPAAEAVQAEATPAEAPAEVKPATPRKKPAPKTGTQTAPKAPAKKKPAAPKAEAPAEAKPEAPAETASVEAATAVLSNVAPETVEAVIGPAEEKASDKVQIGQKMPNYLL